MTRLLTAAVLLPALWAVIKVAPPWLFVGVALVVISVASLELYAMLERSGSGKPFRWVGLVAGWGVVASFLEGDAAPELAPVLFLTVLLTAVLAVSRRPTPAAMLDSAVRTLFPPLLVALGLGYLVRVRLLPGEDGKDLLLTLFLCVIAADSFAYYIGRKFGRRRMAPVLSPKKTWEGAVAGLVGSVLAALIAHAWFYQRLPLVHALILGVVLGMAGIFGDLVESLVKRASDVKDSSHLLPGHGGLLDRTDSLLFAGPVLYYYYLAFLGNPT